LDQTGDPRRRIVVIVHRSKRGPARARAVCPNEELIRARCRVAIQGRDRLDSIPGKHHGPRKNVMAKVLRWATSRASAKVLEIAKQARKG